MDINSRIETKILDAVNGFVQWRPDSQAIVYSRTKYLDDFGKVETQIYTMAVDTLQETLVFSKAGYFSSEGFLDNQTLLYLDPKNDTMLKMQTLNLNSGETGVLREIDVPQPWVNTDLSPDNSTLLITRLDESTMGRKYELITVSLATGEKKTVLTYPYDDRVNTNPIYRLQAKWWPNSQQLLIRVPPQTNQPTYLGLVPLEEKASLQPFLDNSSFLEKVSGYKNFTTVHF